MVSIRGFVYRRVCRFGRRYGFGILMSEVLTRRRPFASMSSSKPVFMVQEIIRGKRPGLPDIDDDLTLLAAGPKGTPCVHLRHMLALRCLTPPPPICLREQGLWTFRCQTPKWRSGTRRLSFLRTLGRRWCARCRTWRGGAGPLTPVGVQCSVSTVGRSPPPHPSPRFSLFAEERPPADEVVSVLEELVLVSQPHMPPPPGSPSPSVRRRTSSNISDMASSV